jgi:phosphoribosyl 1,2-cyclic phosphate phosphodiesterase
MILIKATTRYELFEQFQDPHRKEGFQYLILVAPKEENRKVLYCPCHSMYLPIIGELYNVDLLIMGLGYINTIKDGVTNFERDNIRLINELKPQRVVFTHFEEVDELNFDDYKNLEQKYSNL